MKASEVKKMRCVTDVVEMISGFREVKYHNCEGVFKFPVFKNKWVKTSLYDVYKQPSEAKIAINETILRDCDEVFGVSGSGWEYRGNCMTFTMENNFPIANGKWMHVRFTKDYLHVNVWD